MNTQDRRRRRGFTLTELMVALTIITIMTGVIALNVVKYVEKARVQRAVADVKVLAAAVMEYDADHRRYPTPEQGLEALVRKPTRPPVPAEYPAGGYLQTDNLPLDPWNRPYVYVTPGPEGRPFEILSLGRDGVVGGMGQDADISNLIAQ
ncbi:MAG: type II secretion system major pseudopilin GspG [Kiritimatiellae bacterium]|nr:type II secretion system major pseudopilin GspG [Kiritimatiellia bacterium]